MLCRTYLRALFGTREQIDLMEHDWDKRARENARRFVATGKDNWTDQEFFASGERTASQWTTVQNGRKDVLSLRREPRNAAPGPILNGGQVQGA
jgi:hypothetical protein